MKRVTFAILCLLSISCFNLLAGQKSVAGKPHLRKLTDDGKVVAVGNNPYYHHIRIYLSNGGKIENNCSPSASYLCSYLRPAVDTDYVFEYGEDTEYNGYDTYKECWHPTDMMIIALYKTIEPSVNENWDEGGCMCVLTPLWFLCDELKDKYGVHIIDSDLSLTLLGKWIKSEDFHHFYIKNEHLYRQHAQRGFSIDPKNIKKIELWNDRQEL